MSQVHLFPPDWNMTDFPQRLRQLRTARKITQTRVAELLGVSPRVYTRWENGDATPLFGTEGNQRRCPHPQPGVAPPVQEGRSALGRRSEGAGDRARQPGEAL